MSKSSRSFMFGVAVGVAVCYTYQQYKGGAKP